VSILDKINGHGDLQNLTDSERTQLCQEIRQFLVSSVSATGGHLASNLGVVELTVAIETVFDTDKDRLVFDVGHQSYVHKLLTGRRADFARLRQFGGIAGFPKPSESHTDAFVAGHASSSVSIALGMARARTLQEQDYHVVALIGDGAATGGMAYEGLNDAAVSKEPMVVILNDNEMSIDRNVGGLAKHLSRLRTKEQYLGMKERYRSMLRKIPGGQGFYKVTRAMKDWLKRALIPATLFENMGLTYLGPVDGHDLPGLISLLKSARELQRPVLVHVLTQKGRGYEPAEGDPSQFHGVGKFDPATGAPTKKSGITFSGTFGEKMLSLAEVDSRVCAVTAAMPGGTGLLKFKHHYPKRLFDVGIAEEHAVSMAGGLAKQGMVPVVALYSTFLQRAYDQIMQDIALLQLHVVLAVDRAGLVGEDGETHHGVFDVGFLRQVPGMVLLAPASCQELSAMLEWAVEDWNGPVAVRYPRGGNGDYSGCDFDPSSGISVHRKGTHCAIITYGTMLNPVMEAAELLSQHGVEAAVIRLTKLNPLPVDALQAALGDISRVMIVEETAAGSGICGDLAYELGQRLADVRFFGMDLGSRFVPHGDLRSIYCRYGLDEASIARRVMEVLGHES